MYNCFDRLFTNLVLSMFVLSFCFLTPGPIFGATAYDEPRTAEVTLAWDPNDPAPEGYCIYQRKKGESYDYSQPCWKGTATTGTVDNLDWESTYYFVVRAYVDTLESADSEEVFYVTPPADAAPDATPPTWNGSTLGIGLATDTTTGGSVAIEFDTAVDGVDGENLKFNIYYAQAAGWDNSDWANNSVIFNAALTTGRTHTHALTVNGLTDGVDYTFGVRVEDQSGNENTNITRLSATPTSSGGAPFSDNFSNDSTSNYTVTHTNTKGGVGQFIHDSTGQRLRVLTGDNVGLQFSKDLIASEVGSFGIDFLPTAKYPSGGYFRLILRQDSNNYYELIRTDGYSAGSLVKVVNGVKVSKRLFTAGYTQNSLYQIRVNFSPDQTTATFGSETIAVTSNASSINVNSFEIMLSQQDAYFDNINYNY